MSFEKENLLNYLREKTLINRVSFISFIISLVLGSLIYNSFFNIEIFSALGISFVFSLFLSLIVDVILEFKLGVKYNQISTSLYKFLLIKARFLLVIFFPVFLILILQFICDSYFKELDILDIDFIKSIIMLIAIIIYSSYIFPFLFGKFNNAILVKDIEINDIVKELSAYFNMSIAGVLEIPMKGVRTYNAAQTGTIENKTYIYFLGSWREQFDINEIKAILGHEFAHAKLGHIRRLSVLNLLANAGIIWITMLFYAINIFLKLLGYNLLSLSLISKINLIIASVVLLLVFQLLLCKKMRQFEFEADLTAAIYAGKDNLILALNKLARLNYIPTNKKSLLATHPSIEQRVEKLKLQL